MKRLPQLAAMAALAALTTACAGGMSGSDCAAADWASLGFADGRSGARPKASEARLKACASQGYAVDRAAYDAARAQGLATYCTDTGGFDAGRTGTEYFGVCPSARETAFLAGFKAGEGLRALVLAEEKAMRDYREAADALDQHRFLLKAADKRGNSSTIGNEDRESARLEAAYRQREIARLDQDLPAMVTAIDAARAARAAHEDALRAAGRAF
ncbi:MAG: DUF2799 domain-containing protein [Parvularculaceae bacterium]